MSLIHHVGSREVFQYACKEITNMAYIKLNFPCMEQTTCLEKTIHFNDQLRSLYDDVTNY